MSEDEIPPIDPDLRIGSVELAVSNLSRSVDFYERVLGLRLIARDDHQARLGPDPEHPALVLRDIASPTPVPANSTGLFHIAWLHPTRGALADTVQRTPDSDGLWTARPTTASPRPCISATPTAWASRSTPIARASSGSEERTGTA